MRRQKILIIDMEDVSKALAIIAVSVKPEEYKEGTDSRALVEDAHRWSRGEFTNLRIKA